MKNSDQTGPTLWGERIYLRPVIQADATERYAGWLNDPETTRFLESGRRLETVANLKNYIAGFENRDDAKFLAVILNEGDLHVGNVKLEPINRTHRRAELGIMIGAAEARGRGIGTEAIRLVLRYGFDTLGLHRISLGVRSDNLAAIRCYERLGFACEGRYREAIWTGETFIDSLYMGMLASEFLPSASDD